MSQTLKDHIWTKLGSNYTIMQIYDKHKAKWWVIINAKKVTIIDNFIKQQDISYLDHKHKKTWHLHKNSSISICTWAFNQSDDVFYFKDMKEVNGNRKKSHCKKKILSFSTTQFH